MSNQESPDVRTVQVRVRQELYYQLEVLAKIRKYSDVSKLVRALMIEATMDIPLTKADRDEIDRRRARREPQIEAKNRAVKARKGVR